MRRIILLSTVLLATPFGMESYAADCATTSCQELGYTATSNKGNCLQCPFGNYWFCPKINVIVLINIPARELFKVHREQRVTVNIENVIVQITMFGMLHKDDVLQVLVVVALLAEVQILQIVFESALILDVKGHNNLAKQNDMAIALIARIHIVVILKLIKQLRMN